MSDFSKYDESCEPIFISSSLSEYESKRDFDKTDEPKPEKEKKNKYRFVIQLHKADKAGEHFDLRLENDNGSMSSWVIPKHHLPKDKEKLLAIKVEDHPVSYMKFEGEIKSGYGKGTVKIYDSGTYEEIDGGNSKVFKLNGKKEKGYYNLIHTKGDHWLITKHKLSKEASEFIDKRKEESGNIT